LDSNTRKEKIMNWRNEAMEKLRRYDIMRQALRNIPEEIERLKAEAVTLKSASTDSMFVRGSGSRQEDARINNIIQRQELEQTLRLVRQWLTVTERGLLALDEEQRTILQRLYLYPQKGAIERLCMELGLEQSSVYRKRDQALHRFTAAIYGFSDT
jgi:ArpU family phage transcriptional regulator